MKSIGILTSGGDSPGMNACIAAIVREAAARDIQAVGILRGFEGLLAGDAIGLDDHVVSRLSGRGGTILKTSRNGHLKSSMMAGDIEAMFARVGVDALVVLGGGGSMVAAKELADAGLPVVAVPCTIDNDVQGTDYTSGFDSACNRVISAANDIADTGDALEGRVFLIETLGGDTGHLAVAGAYAIGADAVLVPEVQPDLEAMCSRIKREMEAGKPYGVIVVAEGAGPAQDLAKPIAEMIGKRVRVTALGHAQRGGSPTYWDRKVAREFGEMAATLLAEGESGVMTSFQSGSFTDVPLSVPVAGGRELDLRSYVLINRL